MALDQNEYERRYEDMPTLQEGTTPSNQSMTRYQNRLKAKRFRENYSRDSLGHWKSKVLW